MGFYVLNNSKIMPQNLSIMGYTQNKVMDIQNKKILNRKIKPLVGFFPVFYSIGETIPHVKIAKFYIEKGGRAIFFSHGGKYEYLAKEIGCKVINLQNSWQSSLQKGKRVKEKNVPFEKIMFGVLRKETLGELIDEEIEALKKTGVEALFVSFNPSLCISARVLKIPLVVLISGTSITPYYKSGCVTFPENYENFFTKLVPHSIKDKIARWYLLNNKLLVKDFNNLAKKYQVQSFQYLNDILLGDFTLVCDDIHFLGLNPTNSFPLKNYIGPIARDLFEEQQTKPDDDIVRHLNRPGRSILLIMGSICDK